MVKPISPRGHGAVDYTLAATLLTAPTLLKLSGRARKVYAGLGVTVTVVNALTAQPLGITPVIPFQAHRKIDVASVPIFGALPVLAGVHRERGSRTLWLGMLAALVGNYALTDWDAGNK